MTPQDDDMLPNSDDAATSGATVNSGLKPIKDLPDALTAEQDLNWLLSMRDKLALYLSTLERNAENVTRWLAASRTDIIVSLHQWNRVLDGGDEKAALDLIKKTPAGVLSFLLDMRDADLRGKAAKNFGANSALAVKLQAHPAGIPAEVIEPLPDLDSQDNTPVTPAPKQATQTAAKKTGVLSNWFKGKAEREAEEVARHYENMLDQWHTTRRDLVSLQSDRHYYVDSLMDWIGENLAPAQEQTNADALLRGFENPAYMIKLALDDYNHALLGKSTAIAEEAANYSLLAGLFDRQEIAKFINVFPVLFPTVDTPDSRDLRQMLLKDNGVTSFTELALTRVANPVDQLALFKTALEHEKKFTLSAKKEPAERLSFVLDCIIREHNPLSTEAFVLALRNETGDSKEAAFDLVQQLEVVRKLYGRFSAFSSDATKLAASLKILFGSFNSPAADKNDAIDQLIRLQKTLAARDTKALLELIKDCKNNGCGNRLVSLCHEAGHQPTDGIFSLLGDLPAQDMITGLIDAHHAGLLSNLRAGNDAKQIVDVLAVLNTALSNSSAVSTCSIAEILHIAFDGVKKEGAVMTQYITALSGKDGLIAGIYRSGVDDAKAEMIGILLSPLRDDIARAALLEKTADETSGQTASDLRDLSKSFVGSFMEMPDGSLLCHTDRIANIWFAPDLDNSIHYTSDNGHSIQLAKGVSEEFADDLLSLIRARGEMLPETNGLFNTDYISRIEYKPDGVDVVWNAYHGPLNIDAKMIKHVQSLDGFIHAKDTARADQTMNDVSVRAASVMAIIPYATQKGSKAKNDWLVIDQQGATFICSDLKMPADMGGLIKFGEAWINPARAGIIMLDETKKTAELCQQTRSFEDTLRSLTAIESMAHNVSENFFLTLATKDAGEWAELKSALAQDGKIVTPGSAFSHLYFNFEQLVRLTPYEDDNDSGFYCSKRGREMNSGRIRLAAELRDDLIEAFSKAALGDKLLLTENHILLKEAVIDLFYTGSNSTLTLMAEHDVMDVKTSSREAMRIIDEFAKKPAYMPVDAPSGLHDIIRFDRVTRLHHDSKEKASFATIGSREVLLGADADYLSKWFASLVNWDIEDNAKHPQIKARVAGLSGNMPTLPKVLSHTSASTRYKQLTEEQQASKKAAQKKPYNYDFDM